MKTSISKIFAIAPLIIFVGTKVSLADGWKCDYGQSGHAYGHYKHSECLQYQYYAFRLVYVERQYYPVAVVTTSDVRFRVCVARNWGFPVGGAFRMNLRASALRTREILFF